LVGETKGNIDTTLVQFKNEKRKIDCAKKHFKAIGIDYRSLDDKIPNYWEPEN
jgi:restriction endonuclease